MKSKRAREAAVSAEEDNRTGGAAAEEPPAKKRKSDGEVKAAKKAKKDRKDKKESRKDRKDKKKDIQDLPEEDEAEPMVVDEKTADSAAPAAEFNGDKDKKKSKKVKQKGKDAVEVNGDGKAGKAGKDDAEATELKKKTKKDKKDKKEKVNGSSGESQEQLPDETTKGDADGEKKKSKKDKKDKEEKKDKKEEKKDKKEKKNKTGQADTSPGDANADDAAAEKADRHIVFVGNLPYSATTASIMAHFASLSPASVRCLTKREGGEAKASKDAAACRGIAFVEFADALSQRTCLDRFHHSLFDDGLSPARKINVELTAGGGGTTKHRKEKIRAKNEKLDENRAKRIEREKAAKEDGAGAGSKRQQQQNEDQSQSISDSIHPSRLARNPRLGN